MKVRETSAFQTGHNVLIVDDHPIVRQGLRGIIASEPDLNVSDEASAAPEALSALRRNPPHVIVVDISLKGSDGLELTKAIRAEAPDVPILVMSMHDESVYAARVLRAGANGYIMKQEVAANVVSALRCVLRGGIYLSTRMRQRFLEQSAGSSPAADSSEVTVLTDRELEIFRLIGRGRGTRRIASDLHLSVKTVETHRAHIKDKLQIDTATELVRRAVQWVEHATGSAQG